MAVTFYHFWFSPQAQRVRLALGFKGLAWDDQPLEYFDDETFFELGVQRTVPVLRLDDGVLHTDANDILWRIDELFPGTPPLVSGLIDEAAWQALLDWRSRVETILESLYAPALPAYRDIGTDEAALAAHKAAVQRRFGMSVEALASDRYAGYAQLERETRLKALASHLAQNGFYMGSISIADLLLTADLYPLQLLDGIALPIGLMYYFRRVMEACATRPDEGLMPGIQL